MTRLKNLENCGFIKTILMMLVILGHACAYWSENWFSAEFPVLQSDGLSILYSWINSFHIYAFVLVSGYIFAFKVGGGVQRVFHLSQNQG